MAYTVGTTATFKKGMMVRVTPQMRYDGLPHTDFDTGEVVCCRIWRPRTEAEAIAWRDSEDSKGMDCAGETKLDSPSRSKYPAADETFKIVRARVCAPSGWNKIKGCAQIVDKDGVLWFAKRTDLH